MSARTTCLLFISVFPVSTIALANTDDGPEAVLVFRIRIATALPKLQKKLTKATWNRLKKLSVKTTGVDLTNPRELASRGIDIKRDLLFSMGALGLSKVHRASRMPLKRFWKLYFRYIQKKGPSPLPAFWYDLLLPKKKKGQIDRGVGSLLRGVFGSPKVVSGRPGGTAATYSIWKGGSTVVASWHSREHFRLRSMQAEDARFETAIPSLPKRLAGTTARMNGCKFFDGDLALFVDAVSLARLYQLTSLIQTFSGIAGIDPRKKARLFAMGAAESRSFERMQRASTRAFTHFCEQDSESRWGLTSRAVRALRRHVGRAKLTPTQIARLAALSKMRVFGLKRAFRDGSFLARRYAAMFLWPLVLSKTVQPVAQKIEGVFRDGEVELDPKNAILLLHDSLYGHLW